MNSEVGGGAKKLEDQVYVEVVRRGPGVAAGRAGPRAGGGLTLAESGEGRVRVAGSIGDPAAHKGEAETQPEGGVSVAPGEATIVARGEMWLLEGEGD